MENAPPLLIVTQNPLFAEMLTRHIPSPCQSVAQYSPLTEAAALLLLPENLKEVMAMEALAGEAFIPSLMLLPEEAGRAQPTTCRSLQRPVSLAQLRQEVHHLLQQPRKLHWPDIGQFDPIGLRLSNLFGQSLSLTEKESALLTYLNHQPQAVSRELLLEHVWQYHPDTETHTLETHLYRLRQKLQELFGDKLQIISNEQGYCLIA